MQCSLPSFEQLKNLVKNRKAFLPTVDNPTQADVVRSLDFTAQHFGLTQVNVNPKDKGDDKRRYTVRDQQGNFEVKTFLSWRVSDRINKLFRKGKTEAEVDNIRNNPDNILKRDFGTHVHGVMERLGKHFHTKEGSIEGIWNDIQGSEFRLNRAQFEVLVKNARKLITDINRLQRRIDRNGTVEIRFEQVLVDPVQDVGGTMDVVAIFSDNTAMIYDFKTLSVWEQYVDKNRKIISGDFISQSKREQWKLQMSAYRRILLQYYGVRDVRGSRILPIWLDFNKNKDNKVLPSLYQLQMGEEMSEHLRTVLAGYEKTGIAVVDKFLTTQYENLAVLYKKLGAAERTDRAEIMVNIRAVERAIQDFIEKTELEDLVENMYRVALDVQTRINKGEEISDSELNETIAYFEGISNFQQGIAQNRSVLSIQTDPEYTQELVDQINHLNDHITVINQVLGSLVYHRLDGIINRIGDRYGNIRRQGSEVILDDDNYLRKLFLSGSESSNPFVRHAIDRIQHKYGELRNDLIRVDDTIDQAEQGVLRWLKSKGQNLTDLHKYLLDESGNFHRELSGEFYARRKEARNNVDVTFFTTYMEIKPTNNRGETYQQWYDRSKKEFKGYLEQRFQYLRTRKSQKAYDDKINGEMNDWEKKNNLQLDRFGKPVHAEAWTTSHWLIPNAKAKSEFISEAYNVIAQSPELKAYYHTMLDIVSELRAIAGYDQIRSYNFFPKVRSSMIEKLSRSEFSGIHEDLKAIFAVREDEQGFGAYNVATGEFEKSIPLFFTNPILDANGQPSTDAMSKDIGASMRLFAKTVFNYKYMNDVEGEMIAIKEILPTVQYLKRDAKGNIQFDQHHNIAVKDKSEGTDTTEKVFAAYVDYYLYGIRVSSTNDNFTKAVLQLRNYFSLKTLGLGFIGGTSSYVAARAAAWMEGQKGILYNKEQWSEATKDSYKDSKKYHALGYFFGIHNNTMLENIVQGRTRAVLADKLYASKLQQYVSSRLLLRPYSYGDERLDNHIAVAMSKNYGVDELGNVRRLENLPEGTPSIWDMFTYEDGKVDVKNISEEQLKNVLVQFRLAVRSGQKGVKGTMSDEDIAYSSTDLLLSTMMQFKSWMPGILNERFGKLRYNEIVDAPVWGRYKAFWSELTSKDEMEQSAKTSIALLQATAMAFGRFGKLLLQNNRISRKLGFGYELDERRLEIELADYRQKSGDSRITLEQYKKIKSAQLRAMVSEIEILVLFTSMVVLLGSDADDDGEPLYKDHWVLHQLYRVINRAKTEIAFTYAPSEYAKLISSPIPLAGLALQAERLLTNTIDEAGDTLFGEETERFPIPFGRNRGSDERDAFYYTFGLIPGGHNLRKMFDDEAVR